MNPLSDYRVFITFYTKNGESYSASNWAGIFCHTLYIGHQTG